MENFSFLSAAEIDAMDILRKKIKRISLPPKKDLSTKKQKSEGIDENTHNTEMLTNIMKKFVVLLQRHKKDKEYLSAKVNIRLMNDMTYLNTTYIYICIRII